MTCVFNFPLSWENPQRGNNYQIYIVGINTESAASSLTYSPIDAWLA